MMADYKRGDVIHCEGVTAEVTLVDVDGLEVFLREPHLHTRRARCNGAILSVLDRSGSRVFKSFRVTGVKRA
jgi:hypothetical protein